MSELWRESALELAAMIRGREVSSREVVQAHLDRVEAVNPHVNAIVRLLPEQALAAADGLPVGVQVMGGKYTELRCLAIAEAIEQRLGPLTPIDPVA